jgi:glutamyl-tRNA synthetase
LINWWIARQRGWRVILRVDDLDGPRVKKGADRAAIEDLKWFGVDWDDGPVYQSPRAAIYRSAAMKLVEGGLAYPCVCTRKDVERAASAPHAEDGSAVYPGTCRGKYASFAEAERAGGRTPVIRFAVPPGEVVFHDEFLGRRTVEPAKDLGDFVILKADGTAAYQLAVVIDDAESGVTDVVRGDDLVDSTPRQILLYRALGLAKKIPAYCHLPLVVGADGRRLAKRHGDTRLSHYRDAGVTPERVVALIARWCGMEAEEQASARDLVARFDLATLPRESVTFTDAADAWLCRG